MNIKEMVIIVGLALITTKGIEYFLFPKQTMSDDAVRSGESFVAPKSRQELRELNREVDFVDLQKTPEVIKTEVETDHARLVFSTCGASLELLDFKRSRSGVHGDVVTIFPLGSEDKEKRCFLLALDEQTPYYYTFISQVDYDDRIEVTYQADFYAGRIQKTFIVFKTVYKIDLKLNLVINKAVGRGVRPRLFFPAPIMPDIATSDVLSGLVSDDRGSLTVSARKDLEDKGWFAPTFIGAENRYFVHAMVSDQGHFAQRGYYRLTGVSGLSTILEGPEVVQDQSWTVSFYFGPKEQPAMSNVDPRLDQTLGFTGFFGSILSPIAKWLLILLNYLYRYLGNYGLAIIALTILIKLVLLPFSYKSAQGMKKTGEFQHKLKYVQQKYKDNPERLAQEKLELMQKEGMPGLSGCLPLLMQLPVFFALSRLLATSIELYQAPFALWSDLAAPDPYYVLPALIVMTMLLQATTVDPKQRMTMIIPAMVLGAVSVSLSAGLCLYIVVSTFLGVLQSIVQKKLDIA